MKSALPKVLHPLLGRTLLGHVLAAADAAAGRAARSSWSATAPTRSTAHLRRGRAGRRAGAAGRAARHRARGPDRAGGGAGRSPAPWWCSTATCRCCGRRRWRALVEAHEAAGAGGHRADRRGGRPDRPGPDRPRRGRQPGADRRGARRVRRGSGRSGRSTPGIYAFDAALLREALGKLSTDNDQGEEYLTDVFGLLVDAGQPVGVHVAADADGDAGLQRPGRAGGAAGAAARPGQRRLDAGRRVDPRPGDHLDRRDRDARPDAVIDQNTQLLRRDHGRRRARSSGRTPR